MYPAICFTSKIWENPLHCISWWLLCVLQHQNLPVWCHKGPASPRWYISHVRDSLPVPMPIVCSFILHRGESRYRVTMGTILHHSLCGVQPGRWENTNIDFFFLQSNYYGKISRNLLDKPFIIVLHSRSSSQRHLADGADTSLYVTHAEIIYRFGPHTLQTWGGVSRKMLREKKPTGKGYTYNFQSVECAEGRGGLQALVRSKSSFFKRHWLEWSWLKRQTFSKVWHSVWGHDTMSQHWKWKVS